MSLSTTPTNSTPVKALLRPVSWLSSGPDNQEATEENIRSHCIEKKTGWWGKRTLLEYFGVAGFILTGILGIFGIKNDNNVNKWLGGIGAALCAVIAGIGAFCGVSLSDKNPEEANGSDEQESEQTPKIKAEEDERFKDIKELFTEDATLAKSEGRKKLLKESIDKNSESKVTSLLATIVADSSVSYKDRGYAVEYLKEIGSEDAVKGIVSFFKKGEKHVGSLVSPKVKDALIELKSPVSVEPLMNYLGDEGNNYGNRIIAAQTLGGILPQVALPNSNEAVIKHFTECKNAQVRRELATVLGNLKAPKAVKPLVSCVDNKDEYYEIRIAAIKSLEKLSSHTKGSNLLTILSKITSDETVYDAAYQSSHSIARTFKEVPGMKPKEATYDDLKKAAKKLFDRLTVPDPLPPETPPRVA